MTFAIKPAKPINNRLLIAIAGQPSAGKTTSALRLASGIVAHTGGKICLIDTENKRSLEYAKDFKFNHLPFDPPFSPEKYNENINLVENDGYGEGDVIIIDSMSHEHEGPGGVLDMHDEYLTKKAGNDFAKRDRFNMLGWGHAKKGRKRLINYTLERTPCHIILCFRARKKTDQVKVGGKTKYVDSGLAPIGADEYFYLMSITMVLPQGSNGKPDWSCPTSRINEYGDGPIKNLLYNTDQISEQTGISLSELTAFKEPVETQEDKTKRMSAEIVRELRGCSDESELYLASEDRAGALDEIKELSQSAYDYIMAEHDKIKSSFEDE